MTESGRECKKKTIRRIFHHEDSHCNVWRNGTPAIQKS